MKRFAKAAALIVGLGVALGPHVSASAQYLTPQQKPEAHPYTKRHLYDEIADPRVAIAAAIKQAKAEHKRVILDFGGDWCGDCQVLDIYFHEAPNEELLRKSFVVVHIYIGKMDKNIDLAAQYGVPISKGVPALAVLDAKGKPLHSQQTGEFRDMRHMDAASLTEFLNKWKG